MELTIEQPALAGVLRRARAVVQRRSPIPVLGHLLLEASGRRLAVEATDLELRYRETVLADVDVEGTCLVPADRLGDGVLSLDAGARVALALTPQHLSVRAGRARWQLPLLPVADWPAATPAGTGNLPPVRIEATVLRQLVELTTFSISTEETRYYLNGIYLHVHGEAGHARLRAVSTDGHRLGLADVDAELPDEPPPGVIVPRFALAPLLKLLEGQSLTELRWTERSLVAEAGPRRLETRLMDGQFPDYGRVIPQPSRDSHLVCRRDDLAGAARRVLTAQTEKSRVLKLTLRPDAVTLFARDPDGGTEAEDGVAATWDGIDGLEVGVNGGYLLDLLDGLPETVRLQIEDAGSPWRVTGDPADDVLRVQMPIRV